MSVATKTQPSKHGRRAVAVDESLDRQVAVPPAMGSKSLVYLAGTFDTKAKELDFMRERITDLGVASRTVDISTSGAPSGADVSAQTVAGHHPQGASAVFTGDRGSSVGAMAIAFEHYLLAQDDVGGVLAAGGSGGTALATPAMRALPIGIPKLMLSTVASSDVRPYVGGSDICMMYSVTDVQGLNAISQRVMANAAHAMAGMVANRPPVLPTRPALGLTMFGVTTPCVQAVTEALEDRYDCLVFHATGTGGQSMEKLADSGWLVGVIDTTTTEVADEIAGGIFSAGPERFDAIVRSGLPYVGSCGGLDMVNFAGIDTVPARHRQRLLYEHNANVTLMRTTAEECAAAGRFIAAKLNRMQGPVRFFLPLGGLSALDAPGAPFWDPRADQALFDAIEADFVPAPNRRLVRSPLHLNDPAFAALVVAAFESIAA